MWHQLIQTLLVLTYRLNKLKFTLAEIFKLKYILPCMELTTNEIAQQVGLTRARIAQLIREQIITGEKRGRDWLIDESQVEVIRRLPENRGTYKRLKPRKNKLQVNKI